MRAWAGAASDAHPGRPQVGFEQDVDDDAGFRSVEHDILRPEIAVITWADSQDDPRAVRRPQKRDGIKFDSLSF